MNVEINRLSWDEYHPAIHNALLANKQIIFINRMKIKKRLLWFHDESIVGLLKKYGVNDKYASTLTSFYIDINVKVISGRGILHQLVYLLIKSLLSHKNRIIAIANVGLDSSSSQTLENVLLLFDEISHHNNLRVQYFFIDNDSPEISIKKR